MIRGVPAWPGRLTFGGRMMDTKQNDDNREDRTEKRWEGRAPAGTTRWLVILGLLLVAAIVFGGGYAYQQSMATSDLTVQNQSLHSTIDQLRNQIDTLTGKLEQMATPPPAPAPVAKTPAAKRATSGSSSAQDRRMKQVQSRLDAQEKELKETQDQLASAKSDLENSLGSTRDELNGTIARNHDELVTFEKRGERSYFEFDLPKSKSYEHEGPIQISLRKADSKHQSYDLMMLVDDHQLSKKKVDLYEPIWLHEGNQGEAVQVVVNKIDKDRIHGYVSAPKYTDAQLTSSAAQPATDATAKPISSSTPSSSSYSTSNPPSVSTTSSQGQ